MSETKVLFYLIKMPKFEAPSVIFHHHHILDQNLYNNELLQEEQTCNCRACHLRMKLLPNMCVVSSAIKSHIIFINQPDTNIEF